MSEKYIVSGFSRYISILDIDICCTSISDFIGFDKSSEMKKAEEWLTQKELPDYPISNNSLQKYSIIPFCVFNLPFDCTLYPY